MNGGGREGITAKSVQILGGTTLDYASVRFVRGGWAKRGEAGRVASLGRRRKPRKLCDETPAGFSGIARLRFQSRFRWRRLDDRR